MNRRNLLLSAGLIAATMVPGLAAADTLDDIRARGVVRVAIDLGSSPWGSMDASMQPTGAEVESARLLAGHLGVELEIVETTDPNRIPFLLTGKADLVMAALAMTPERREVIDYSQAYAVIPILVAATESTKVETLENLNGKSVAVVRGSTNDAEASKIPGVTVMRYDDNPTVITSVVSGQNEYFVGPTGILNAINERLPQDPLVPKIVQKELPYGVGIRKGEPALKEVVDEWVQADLTSGQLNEIFHRYFGFDLPAVIE